MGKTLGCHWVKVTTEPDKALRNPYRIRADVIKHPKSCGLGKEKQEQRERASFGTYDEAVNRGTESNQAAKFTCTVERDEDVDEKRVNSFQPENLGLQDTLSVQQF